MDTQEWNVKNILCKHCIRLKLQIYQNISSNTSSNNKQRRLGILFVEIINHCAGILSPSSIVETIRLKQF